MRLPAEKHPGLLATQELEAARKDCRGSTALPTPRFQASGLQNYKGIHICCFRPRSLCSLLQQPQETNTGGSHYPSEKTQANCTGPQEPAPPRLHLAALSSRWPSLLENAQLLLPRGHCICRSPCRHALPHSWHVWLLIYPAGLKASREAFPDHATQSTAAWGFRIYFLHSLASVYV